MPSRSAWLLCVVALTFFAGCGGQSSAGPSNTGHLAGVAAVGGDIPGYLALGSRSTAFLQWTRTGSSLSGMLTYSYIGQMHELLPYSWAITGVIGGSSLTLRSSDTSIAAFYAPIMRGVFHGSDLVLTYPTEMGTLATQYFRPATVRAYNAAVASLNKQVARLQRADATATAVAVASTCAVVANYHADLAVTVTGSGRWTICRELVRFGSQLHATGMSTDFSTSSYYSEDCASTYRGDTVTIYDNGASGDMIAQACESLRHHTLPVLDGGSS